MLVHRSALRTALVRHVLVALVVGLVALGFVGAGIALFARQEAYRSAAHLADQVGAAVGVQVSGHDLSVPVDGPTRTALNGTLEPFLASGITARIKIWSVAPQSAQIVYSDEARLQGEVVHLGGSRFLNSASVPHVQSVPDDGEHRFEIAQAPTLLEVFTSFRDRTGAERWLELYVRTDEAGTARASAATVVTVAAAGLLLITLGTLPVSFAVARRLERARAEQRAARDYGFSAADTARLEIAERLHSGVIPDLASVGLLLEAARANGADDSQVARSIVADAHDLLAGEMRQLRSLLDDLASPAVVQDGLPASLRRLAAELGGVAGPSIDLDVVGYRGAPTDVELLLHRVAHELVRNALRHAGPTVIQINVGTRPDGVVVLEVIDDGRGFDVEKPKSAGHVGLVLVRQLLAERGGHLRLTSAARGGVRAEAWLPATSTTSPSARLALSSRGDRWLRARLARSRPPSTTSR